ncbi:rhodanese-like domain-containing protein [Alicyclobacillus curvatus]|jgi:rhodanese-related sulfurtransferase|nr:rhodanese-like domain-containing protein [Alicyclobacillus curvatus]
MGVPQWMSVDVKEYIRSNKPIQIIDVRQPGEYMSGHIPGAKLIPLNELPGRFNEIDPSKESVIVCHSGGRSSMACEFLQGQGYNNIHNLLGGMSMWDGEIE